MSISCASIKKQRNDFPKFAIANSSEFGLPIPSHFSLSTFTISAFDNFDHADKNTFSGKSGSHDTVITLFQEILTKKVMKTKRSEANLAAVKTLELVPFSTDKTLTLPEPFTAETEIYNSNEKKNDNQ